MFPNNKITPDPHCLSLRKLRQDAPILPPPPTPCVSYLSVQKHTVEELYLHADSTGAVTEESQHTHKQLLQCTHSVGICNVSTVGAELPFDTRQCYKAHKVHKFHLTCLHTHCGVNPRRGINQKDGGLKRQLFARAQIWISSFQTQTSIGKLQSPHVM